MGHRACLMLVVIWTLLIFLGSVAFAAYYIYEDQEGWPGGDLSKSLDLDEMYPTKLTPSSWLYIVVWPVIYLFTFIWLGYGLSTLCRNSSVDTYLYYDPPYLPVAMYLLFSFTRLLGAFWLYMASRGEIWEDLIILAVMTVFASIALFVAVGALDRYKDTLLSVKRRDDIALTIAFVHNGIGMYAAWLLIATLLQLTSCLQHVWDVDEDTSCYISLSFLLFFFIALFLVDNFAIYEKTKYLFTPYVVVIVAMAAVLQRIISDDDVSDPVSVIVITVLAIAAVFLLIKVLMISVKERKRNKEFNETKFALNSGASGPVACIDQYPPPVPAVMAPPAMVQTLPAAAPQQIIQYGYPAPAAPATVPMYQGQVAPQAVTYESVPNLTAPVYTNVGKVQNGTTIDVSTEGTVPLNTRDTRSQSIKESIYVASN